MIIDTKPTASIEFAVLKREGDDSEIFKFASCVYSEREEGHSTCSEQNEEIVEGEYYLYEIKAKDEFIIADKAKNSKLKFESNVLKEQTEKNITVTAEN